MASYTVDFARTATTTANVVDKITFTRVATEVEVVNHDSTTTLWVSVNGQSPAIDGVDSVPVLPSTSWTYRTNGIADVSVISSGAVKYTIVSNNR
jgi:hypothetical protein